MNKVESKKKVELNNYTVRVEVLIPATIEYLVPAPNEHEALKAVERQATKLHILSKKDFPARQVLRKITVLLNGLVKAIK